jgi:hypothetical protein
MPAHLPALDTMRMIQPKDVADACVFIAKVGPVRFPAPLPLPLPLTRASL